MNTSEQIDHFAGLPAFDWAGVIVRRFHPKSVPFGDKALHYVQVPAGTLVGVKVPQ